MVHSFTEASNAGIFRLHVKNAKLGRDFFRERDERLLTIAWNPGKAQTVQVDGEAVLLAKNALLPLMVNQSFTFTDPEAIIAWQFNREFYCIVDHDHEVSCVGLLFYANTEVFTLAMDKPMVRRFELLTQVMEDEFGYRDRIQGDMLRALLKRLIILVTRLTRDQRTKSGLPDGDVDLVRKFNLLVENHYKEFHSVKQYAALLHRSPKTLSNVLKGHSGRSPLEVIHHRITLEARRMLMFTDRPVKEIAYTIGFEDAALFARFFKQRTGTSPIDFRRHEALGGKDRQASGK
jgi:AraC family transcriptional regulator, transcriptional activator of pobA